MSEESAEAFLESSNAFFEECSHGISQLDRIIVGCPSSLTEHVRLVVIPALYAYWERFFRLSFAEFLRCVTMCKRSTRDINATLTQTVIRQILNEHKWERKARVVQGLKAKNHEEIQKALSGAKGILERASALCDLAFEVLDPDKLVSTDSNVRYEVIEKNCKQLGLSIGVLKAMTESRNLGLYQSLKDLVDLRNEIAHGTRIHSVSSDKWNDLRDFTVGLMLYIQQFLYDALLNEKYLSPT